MPDGDTSRATDTPSLFMLRAAFLAARVIRGTTTTRTERTAGYWRLPTGGIFSGEDLLAGERILDAAGFIVHGQPDDVVHAESAATELASLPESEACGIILVRYLAASRPAWLTTALGPEGLQPELLPESTTRLFDEMDIDFGRREAVLLAAAQRVDPDRNADIGAKGEGHVVDLARRELHDAGRPDLALGVRRVSLMSDALGYDVVAPSLSGVMRRWEVKTTASERRLRIYLSRNEAEYGRRDPRWALVACRLTGDQVELIGWCTYADLAARLPQDRHVNGKWHAVEIDLAVTDVTAGLPH